MKWIEERDALIAQTMAFVQSISRGQQTVSQSGPGSHSAAAAKPQAEPEPAAPVAMRIVQIPGPPKTVPSSRQFDQVDVKTEIETRIAGFRAHQERFNRERHEYFSATLARLRASIEQLPPPRSGK